LLPIISDCLELVQAVIVIIKINKAGRRIRENKVFTFFISYPCPTITLYYNV
jgi:hypothetical protein